MANARQWPKDFKLDARKREYAIEKGVDPRKVEDFWEDFHDWALESEVKRKDWNATFRMRVRKAKEWNLFQGKAPEKRKPKINPNINMSRAYDIRCRSLDEFISWAKQARMSPTDVNIIEFKYQREVKGLTADKLVGRIGG